MALLKTLLIIVAIWYFFKFAFRFFGPMLIKKAIKKAEENFQKQAGGFYQQNQGFEYQDSQDQSNIFKNGVPREKKKVGEYIEFEEIN